MHQPLKDELDEMPFCWPCCSLLFCFQLFSIYLLLLYRLVVWVHRTDRVTISLSRPCIPIFFNNNNNKNRYERTEWVSQSVITLKKNGKVRLCLDPQELNKVLLREHYIMPTIDDILHNLRQSKVFIKADLS